MIGAPISPELMVTMSIPVFAVQTLTNQLYKTKLNNHVLRDFLPQNLKVRASLGFFVVEA